MQFKHPEILYFLFLLVIPILVHLFQLRRFKKEYFTNVKLLKELQTQTRKSSKIKKWLLLATRLLLLACLILAFAQPFFKAKDTTNKGNELIILLDNSFSMQAKGAKGELLKRIIQELLEELPENQQFSLLSNSEVFWDTDIKSIQKEIQNLNYSAMPFQLDYLINQVETKKKNTKKDYVIITDAIQSNSKKAENLSDNNVVYFIQPKAVNKNNVSIDKVIISQVLDQFYELKITLKAFGDLKNEIPLSVFNEEKAIAKTIAKFEKNEAEITITIPKQDFHGKISIEDNSLSYDNDFYMSISKPKKGNVLAIGTLEKNNFLSRIFTSDEFNFTSSEVSTLDYNQIENQEAIILNELEDLPIALGTTLKSFYEKGGNVILIPSAKNSTITLNTFAKNFGGLQYSNLVNTEKQITKINFSHPVYQTVFEKKVTNFQYPKTKESFGLSGLIAVLQFEDNSLFLGSTTNRLGSFYAFSAPINKQNSNFQNAPLIVPTFYKMGQNQGKTGINAFTIGENENLILETILAKEEVISVGKEGYSFIPMQQILNTKCKLSFGDYPEQAGNFEVTKGSELLKKISFNYPRTESDLQQETSATFEKFTKVNNITTVLNDIASERTSNEIWKGFILATLLFLLIELLIQKFIK
ncbi:BatA and WFA domain-containing protein [Flavobacterium psychraquaticum]|uniref:vWA domain-containing protein n=1 Tax=Flavobacterium psychraquaticum TaxID=3103958 RepID=UPI002ACE8AB0|nr:BatA and WFA domain-containing protein [Flavobacterium sp. LB-N7T]